MLSTSTLIAVAALGWAIQSTQAQRCPPRVRPPATIDRRLVPLFDSLTYVASAGRRGGAPSQGPVAHTDASELAVRAEALTSGHADSTVAEALVTLMRGPEAGYSSEQAIVAADLYSALNLPYSPVRALLLDRSATFFSRSQALYVIARRGHYRGAGSDFVDALCSVGVRAAAVWQAESVRATRQSLGHLTTEEADFLSRIVSILTTWHDEGVLEPLHLREAFSAHDEFGGYLRRRLGPMW